MSPPWWKTRTFLMSFSVIILGFLLALFFWWKKSHDLLRQSEDKFKTLFESSRDAILILKPGTGYIDGNPAALSLFRIKDKRELSNISPEILSPETQPDGSLSKEKSKEMRKRLDYKSRQSSET